MKFVASFYLLENENVDFASVEETTNSPLAKALFDEFDYVNRVFIASNFVTLTKDESTNWYEVLPVIKEFIKDYLSEEKPVFTDGIESQIKEKQAPSMNATGDIENKIKSLLDDYVRPAVESDGGAISFHSYDEGVVKVLLQGSCSGCPSSTVTLKSGIENLLKRMMPNEVKEVIAEGV
jgi:Fe-S cluster biogenesis protein NfuA